MAEFTTMIKEHCNVKWKSIATHNPASNVIVEQVHQTVGDVMRSFQMWNLRFLNETSPGLASHRQCLSLCAVKCTLPCVVPLQCTQCSMEMLCHL